MTGSQMDYGAQQISSQMTVFILIEWMTQTKTQYLDIYGQVIPTSGVGAVGVG